MAEPRIEISIDGDTFQLEKKLKDSVGTASRSGDKAGDAYGKGFSDSIKNIAIGNIIADAARAGIRLFTNEITQGVNSLRGLSAATAEANSILAANEKITKGVSNQFREFSEQFGTSQQKQVKAFYGIVSGGVKDTANRLAVLETANTAATAGLVDIDTAATALVSSIKAYSKTGLTATQASDQLFTAVRLGQTTFGELATTVGRVAPIASSLGLTFDELTGSIAGITTGGIATSEAVTGLRAVLSGIIKPTKEAKDAAEEFGIELGGNAIKSVGGFANFLELLIKRTNGSSDAISRLFTSQEALVPILSIAERGVDGFRKVLEQTAGSAGATALAFKDISKNLDFRFNQVESELQNLRIEFAEELLPTIEDLIPLLKNDLLPLVQDIGKLAATSARGVAGLVGKFRDLIDLGETSERQEKFAQGFEAANKRLDNTKKQLENIRRILAGTDEDRQPERFANLERRRLELVKQRNKQEAEIFARRLQAEKVGLIEPQARPGQDLTFTQSADEAPLSQAPESGGEGVEAQTELGALQRAIIAGVLDQAREKGEQLKTVYQSVGSVIGQAFTAAKGKTEEFDSSIKKLTDTVVQGLGQALTSSFSAFGAALANGEDALGAFGAAFLKQIGAIATQVGSFFILQGLGFQVLPGFQASGAALLAAGAGLVALGGFLSAIASPSASASAVSGDSSNFGTDSNVERDRFERTEEEDRQAQQQVQLVVQGDILDSEDTGRRLLALLNENFESESSSLVGASFA